ncbi:GNAT family N-acetyltransferase [Aestuariibacter halophilus]|uniref:GNAT family N-acetyltransferase n=1 Tax=Fluctibacter halophilus TaxID=226011 RepID=A0ABS8GD58_9ALTE|nr:GNAT family N-acetyltransferase [Aestuariibacter halophilus]MCC2617116.1 GNAT family N-acetyltransferase [Aestuariibacter halophilus]
MNTSEIRFLPFNDGLAGAFDRINRAWIEDMFRVEAVDDRVLRYPRETIINKGGHIWFAEHVDLGIVGTCALANKGNGTFELTKMGVLASARGLNIGERLLVYVIGQFEALGCQQVFLLTNKRCEAAIHLYEKHGFVHDAEVMAEYGASYQRCDVAMRYVNTAAPQDKIAQTGTRA